MSKQKIYDIDSRVQWPSGLKKTKQRLDVLEALLLSDKPQDVQELYSFLEKSGNTMWLSTIYRVLETLLEHGLIQKSAVHENGTSLYEIGDAHHHYAVCVECKQIIEIQGCPLTDFLPSLQDKNFHVIGHKLQISGYCGSCYAKQPQL